MSSADSEGPAWNKFWLSLDHETESLMSGDGSNHISHTPLRSLVSPDIARGNLADSSVLPTDSASHVGESPSHSHITGPNSANTEDTPFPFKFKAPSGRVHRMQVTPSAGIAELISGVTAKLGNEVEAVGGEATYTDGKHSSTGYALSYLDNEGDTVSITTDRDLLDAILLARQGRREKVDLFVHDPQKPPVTVPTDPQPSISKSSTPPE